VFDHALAALEANIGQQPAQGVRCALVAASDEACQAALHLGFLQRSR
jgi:hypothetical protein